MSSDEAVRIENERRRAAAAVSRTGRRHSAIIGSIQKWRSYDAWNKTAQQNWQSVEDPILSQPIPPKTEI